MTSAYQNHKTPYLLWVPISSTQTPSVQHKDHTFLAPKIPQFNTPPSVPHPPQFNKLRGSTHPSVPHSLSSTTKQHSLYERKNCKARLYRAILVVFFVLNWKGVALLCLTEEVWYWGEAFGIVRRLMELIQSHRSNPESWITPEATFSWWTQKVLGTFFNVWEPSLEYPKPFLSFHFVYIF